MSKSVITGFLALAVFMTGQVLGKCPESDLNGDCTVDFEDIRALASEWLFPAESDSQGDLDGLNGVETRDFALLAREWSQTGIPLMINEVLASNNNGAKDPQSEADDWIEIYNASGRTYDIARMYLTDDLENPTKWEIPTTNPGRPG
ncbi:MAG: hypothetical protein ACYS8Z_18120 [Planctomycetota bacterium]|jgi:hypothetical protein